jgi:hypothetical protein
MDAPQRSAQIDYNLPARIFDLRLGRRPHRRRDAGREYRLIPFGHFLELAGAKHEMANLAWLTAACAFTIVHPILQEL